ncbi:MAG: hypothetical protein V3V08_17670 [Nannocystaceae bacterium]
MSRAKPGDGDDRSPWRALVSVRSVLITVTEQDVILSLRSANTCAAAEVKS